MRSAYRRRALATHPDKGGNAPEFLEVVEAFEVLSDRVRRAAYDGELRRSGGSDGLCGPAPEAPPAAELPSESRRGAGSGPKGPNEGTGPAEERRVAKLWAEFLEYSPEELPQRIAALSFRAAEGLLGYADSQACAGGAPVVAVNTLEPQTAARDDKGDAGEAYAESCGVALLALCSSATAVGTGPQATSAVGPVIANADIGTGGSAGSAEGEVAAGAADEGGEPPAKRARLGLETLDARSQLRGGARAWICLENLKICTGSSEDVSEAIDWHIMIVRIKQLFDEHSRAGRAFDEALRAAVESVLAERVKEGSSDPRLRFVNEYMLAGGLFTPVTRDLEAALRRRAGLEALRRRGAGHEEVLAEIRRLSAASEAAQDEQARLAAILRQHLKDFSKALRWQGPRPEGVNAAFRSEGPGRVVSAWAEVWGPSDDGLALLCRGPRRRRVDEAISDAEVIRSAQDSGGDVAARQEARSLYEQQMRSSAGLN